MSSDDAADIVDLTVLGGVGRDAPPSGRGGQVFGMERRMSAPPPATRPPHTPPPLGLGAARFSWGFIPSFFGVSYKAAARERLVPPGSQ
jgi:hypothetical protein